MLLFWQCCETGNAEELRETLNEVDVEARAENNRTGLMM